MAKPPKILSGRIPPVIGNIQVNFCKDPKCANFGHPALVSIKGMPLLPGISKAGKRSKDSYTITSRGDGQPELRCLYCDDTPPIKSNLAISEELARMTVYLQPPPAIGCTTPGCVNAEVDVGKSPDAYQRFGTTKAGSQRFRCRVCSKVRSVPTTTIIRQRMSHKNKTIFKCLVNKSPLRRICEIAEVNISTLYDKIDFFHRQCLAYAAHIEKSLPGKAFGSLGISVDRQVYSVNWNDTNEKRNILLNCVGSADNRSSYIFGMHLNFDPTLIWADVERDAAASGDLAETMAPAFRKYARPWLMRDYEVAAARGKGVRNKKEKGQPTLVESYNEAVGREDIEASDQPTLLETLPKTGMQIHSEYTLYGHFLFLKQQLTGARRVRFYMEKESGIRAACHAAFAEDISSRRCDAFYVRINKDLNTHQKMRQLQEGRWELDEFRDSRPEFAELSDNSLRALLIEKRLNNGELHTIGPFKDRWLEYPAPPVNEPNKMICHLTDVGGQSMFDKAKLYVWASLNGIDRYMMLVRRRLSLLERPIDTSSNAGHRWYGYCPYRPEMIIKVLDILRVYYNFVLQGKDKRTPAMRLGLTDRPTKVEEILYFKP